MWQTISYVVGRYFYAFRKSEKNKEKIMIMKCFSVCLYLAWQSDTKDE